MISGPKTLYLFVVYVQLNPKPSGNLIFLLIDANAHADVIGGSATASVLYLFGASGERIQRYGDQLSHIYAVTGDPP